MATKIVYGKYLVIDPDTIIPSGALYIEGDQVVDYGSHAEITSRYRADRTLGSSEMLVIPGLINAHSHGKGLTDFQRGQIDDTLESWKWRCYPPIDPYLDTRWTCVQLLESGVTATMHNHGLVYPENWQEEFEAVLKAYRECGVRVAFAPTLNTENVFTYGDDESFIATLPADLQALCHGILARMAIFGEKEYFQAVDYLRKRFDSSRVQIMHGPIAPQWVRRDALDGIKKQAVETGMRVHTHLQQTQMQRLYGFKRYRKSLLAYLFDIDFLSPQVTCGHCVWISEDDIELLAQTGASVTHHPGCNLRVRNGISPVYYLVQRGVTVALGMDDKEIGDDKDFLAEMRLASKLHRLPHHYLDSPHLFPKDVFRMATSAGATVLGFDRWIGTLQRGKQADLVLLDLDAMAEPFVYEGHNPLDILLYRGKAAHIHTVLVAGDILLENGRLTQLDRNEIARKLRESIPANYAERFQKENTPFVQLRSAIAAHFALNYEKISRSEISPYYLMNNRS